MKTISNLLFAGISMAVLVNGFGQPVITKQPSNQTASLFGDTTFLVNATDTASLTYQWQFKQADIKGATNNSLTITNVQRSDGGPYAVIVSDASASVTSQVATLTIVPFSALYCFGFSWTDSRTDLHACGGPVRCPTCYWKTRYSNGPMWPELLSTNLGFSFVNANNYAWCGAESGNGDVSGVLSQVTSYQSPKNPQFALYSLMAGDGDFLYAADANYTGSTTSFISWTNDLAWNGLIQTSLKNNSNAIQRLYARGARSIVVDNLFDLSRLPALVIDFGTNVDRGLRLRQREQAFNAGLASTLDMISAGKPDVRLMLLDLYSKLNEVFDNPHAYGFTKTFPNALDDPKLTDKSLTGPGKDYVFWDKLHPTSKVHELMAGWHLGVLTNSILETLDVRIVDGPPNIQMNHLQIGRDYTLQHSADLRTWSDVQSFTAAAGTNQWSGAVAGSMPNYFRLKWAR